MKKYPTLIFIALLAVLLFSQQKIVMPLVYEVIKSDFFLVDSKDQASQLPISTHMTDIAFANCNKYIKSNLESDALAIFSNKPLNAWSLGNYQYVINAEVDITHGKSNTITKRYACRITYKNGDNPEGIEDVDNWTVTGLSGIDEI
ncbi:MAG: hypothetical protein PHR16_16845 [Methylovulum sp.]|nr:hypothetical protein [Methylovulum sp.]